MFEVQDWEEGDGNYVAPELLSDHNELTPAADIYSLGATLYECATGMLWPVCSPVHLSNKRVPVGKKRRQDFTPSNSPEEKLKLDSSSPWLVISTSHVLRDCRHVYSRNLAFD